LLRETRRGNTTVCNRNEAAVLAGAAGQLLYVPVERLRCEVWRL